MKKIIAMLLAAIMMLSLAACGEKTPETPDDAKDVLVMGTSADYAPYEFMYPDANGNMVFGGIDISVAQAIAVGDEGNDVAMIRAAGLGVAMGNATDDVIAAADAVTADCDHDGVAQVIYDYLLKEE